MPRKFKNKLWWVRSILYISSMIGCWFIARPKSFILWFLFLVCMVTLSTASYARGMNWRNNYE
jgi:hypothetical protein